MNKVCVGLIRKSLEMGHKHLADNNGFLFASSKHNKPNKSQTSRPGQTQNKQILRSSSNMLSKGAKPTSPQQSQQGSSIISEQQKKQLAFQHKLQSCYTQIESFPTDSYETVVQNFKRAKAKLNDRKVYVPNKPQLLTQLDSNMQLIRKNHKVWRSPSTQNERSLSDSKKEIIQFELEQAKKNYYLSLLANQKVLIGVASGVVLFVGGLEYNYFVSEEMDPELVPPKMYI